MKALLQIDNADTSEDKLLGFLIEMASNWIEELLGRNFTFKQRTEYLKGSGTQKLLLKNRPAFAVLPSSPTVPAIQVFLDEGAYYGATSGAFTAQGDQLVYGQDFALQIDQEDGISSRCAILIKLNSFWPKPCVREAGWLSPYVGQSFGPIKVTYWAGYTVDTLPSSFRLAANLLIAKLRTVFPLGVETAGEGYEERSLSVALSQKEMLLRLVKPMILPYLNFKW